MPRDFKQPSVKCLGAYLLISHARDGGDALDVRQGEADFHVQTVVSMQARISHPLVARDDIFYRVQCLV